MAIAALTDSAGNANGFDLGIDACVEPVGIDQGTRVPHFASQSDRVAPHGRAPCPAGFAHIPRQAEIAFPVGRLGHLP